MVFEIGTMALPDTAEELLELVKEPLPHIPVEVGLQASDLAKRAEKCASRQRIKHRRQSAK